MILFWSEVIPAKQDDPDEGVAGYKESHAHDDEEWLVHRHQHSLDQHFQSSMFPGDGEETEYDHHVAQGQSVLIVKDVVEDNPDNTHDGDEQIDSVPWRRGHVSYSSGGIFAQLC